MKKIIFLIVSVVSALSVGAQSKDKATFTATIANSSHDAVISSKGKPIKTIIGKNGLYNDTFAIDEGVYELKIGEEFTRLYLKNGLDLKLRMDVKQFDESIVYEGSGAAENNFLAKEILLDEQANYSGLFSASAADFEAMYGEILKGKLTRLEDKKLAPSFVSIVKKETESEFAQIKMAYNKMRQDKEMSNALKNTMAPSFDYVNYKGGKSKLEDFRGKYVYIDLWATWCGPCRAEIPFLKDAEKKYHNKNIEFVSISIDKQTDMEKWKKMITEQQLTGVQLLADKDKDSQFVRDFKVTGIPRFILIDPAGKVVNADAPRPSSPELASMLDGLLK